jgi:hypothetical protein
MQRGKGRKTVEKGSRRAASCGGPATPPSLSLSLLSLSALYSASDERLCGGGVVR